MKTIEERIQDYIDSMIPYCHEEGVIDMPLYSSIGIKDMMRYVIKEEQKGLLDTLALNQYVN